MKKKDLKPTEGTKKNVVDGKGISRLKGVGFTTTSLWRLTHQSLPDGEKAMKSNSVQDRGKEE